MTRTGLIAALTLAGGLCTGVIAEPAPQDAPSIELLEYLAEFVETDDGGLLDPLDVEPADEHTQAAQRQRGSDPR